MVENLIWRDGEGLLAAVGSWQGRSFFARRADSEEPHWFHSLWPAKGTVHKLATDPFPEFSDTPAAPARKADEAGQFRAGPMRFATLDPPSPYVLSLALVAVDTLEVQASRDS